MSQSALRNLLVSSLILTPVLLPAPAGAEAPMAGPSLFGYVSIDTGQLGGPPFTFIDISGTGTQLTFFDADALPTQNTNADDGVALDISLASLNSGLGFPYFGAHFTSVNMSTNGFLHFDLNGESDALTDTCPLPNSGEPNNMIAVLWDDLVLRNPPVVTSGGYTQAFTPCPYTAGGVSDCVVFQWDNADHFGGGIESFDFQAVLYESGNILMLYGALNPEHGSGSTTGLEGPGAADGLVHACNTLDSLPDASAVLFRYPTPVIYDNGPLATGATSRSGVAAPAGTQWSEVANDTGSTTAANTAVGFGCQRLGATSNRCADDFTVPAGDTFTVTQVRTYGYQSGFAGALSPILDANVQIWNGRPGDPGSVVIAGDAVSLPFASFDVLLYRIPNSGPPVNAPPGTTRRVWEVTMALPAAAVLAAGTYWVDLQLDAGAGGNFTPPLTLAGFRTIPGWNARQFQSASATWVDLLDIGNPTTAPDVAQDLSFQLVGSRLLIFGDGFNSGTTGAWSAVIP